MSASIVVKAVWDEEAGVFTATSEDVPGLVAEAETFKELNAKLAALIPVLLEENGALSDVDEVPMFVVHEQMTKIRLHA